LEPLTKTTKQSPPKKKAPQKPYNELKKKKQVLREGKNKNPTAHVSSLDNPKVTKRKKSGKKNN